MEVKEKSKKREIIKTVAIVFLVVLLLLTFFSNTIMNRSLPEVATQSISSGTINAKIRGSGTVAANESYEVIIDQTREVRTVCVQVGDSVTQGDLLFVLGDMESEELQAAQEQLDSLNLQYQQQLLTLSGQYASEDRAIQVLREDLALAVAQRDANLVSAEELSMAKGNLEMVKNELEQITRALEELQASFDNDDAYAAAEAEVTTWTQAVAAAEGKVSSAQSKLEAAQDAVESYEEQIEELEITGELDSRRSIEDAEEALQEAEYTWRSLWRAYSGTLKLLVTDVWDTDKPPINPPNTDTDTPQYITNEQQVYLSAYLTKLGTGTKDDAGEDDGAEDDGAEGAGTAGAGTGTNASAYRTAYNALIDAQEDVDAKERVLERALEDADDMQDGADRDRDALERKLGDAEDERDEAEEAVTAAGRELSSAQRMLRQAEWMLEQAKGSNASLKQQIVDQEALQREKTAMVDSLTQTLADLEAKKGIYDQAQELVTERERAIADALVGRDTDMQLDSLELESIQRQIEKAQELVDRHTAQTVGTEVTANVSGTISAIHVAAGNNTTAGAAMATIEVVDRGYTLKIPVTNEQSQQVRVGDTANVTNYYWGSEVEATLEAIAADPENPGRGKLLVFRITGEVDAGSNLTLSIGQRSANYDTLIPKSALREDTNGYFVLVVTVKSSPLSNRYIATRVDVQVLAEDETSAAVSGLSAGDFVITTSSKPVEAGAQVRMVENP